MMRNSASVRDLARAGKSRAAGIVAMAAALLLHPAGALACAACYGQSDAPMARGMNWGIFSLLCVVGVVLGIFSSFFVFLAKRANGYPTDPSAAPVEQSINRTES